MRTEGWKLRRKARPTLPDWYRKARGTSAWERRLRERHGRALESSLAARAQRKALASGRPYKHAEGRDYHNSPLKRFLLRCIATVREMAR